MKPGRRKAFRIGVPAAAAVSAVAFLVAPTQAAAPSAASGRAVTAGGSLLWSADPKNGTGAFQQVQCPTSSDFAAVADPAMGTVWKVTQPAQAERCEAVGPSVKSGSSFYLGWSSKFDITDTESRYIFQLKCDPSTGTANHPIVLEVVGGRIELEDWTTSHQLIDLWSTPAVNLKWNSYALHVTEGRTDGTIQFWFNGKLQTLSNGKTTFTGTTYDGTSDYLKWGLYHTATQTAYQWLTTLKQGTTLSSVGG